jgi:hypothetical protein
MAAATVIHFGSDLCHRVPVLRREGYEVRELDSLDCLRMDLGRDKTVDAVIVSEFDPHCAEQAANLVRQSSDAPLILFRDSSAQLDESLFDRVYSCFTPGSHWLSEMAAVVIRSKELRAQSQAQPSEARSGSSAEESQAKVAGTDPGASTCISFA